MALEHEMAVEHELTAITIDSPRWRDGWGQPLSGPPAPTPALRLVGAGTRRPDPALVRRRRFAAVLAVLGALAAGLALAATTLARPATAGSLPAGRQTHVVEPGDTYWSIAAGLGHDGDPRVAVDALIDANGGRPLFAGDRIELP